MTLNELPQPTQEAPHRRHFPSQARQRPTRRPKKEDLGSTREGGREGGGEEGLAEAGRGGGCGSQLGLVRCLRCGKGGWVASSVANMGDRRVGLPFLLFHRGN